MSPIDKEAQKYWNDYSVARNKMLLRTNFKYAPWFVVNADKKKAAHIALITHLLMQLKYQNKDKKLSLHDYELVYPVTPENIKEKLY
jgi:polyphosphate kinase 2 (PPK2 family)